MKGVLTKSSVYNVLILKRIFTQQNSCLAVLEPICFMGRALLWFLVLFNELMKIKSSNIKAPEQSFINFSFDQQPIIHL
jgi:hypothetical protein